MESPQITPALRFALGTDTEEDRQHLRRALLGWLLSPGPALHVRWKLHRRTACCALRNRHLAEAARHLAGDPWQRATDLSEAARAFAIRRLPRWQRFGPPPNATPLDLELHRAAAYGEIVLTPRQYLNILD